MSKTENIVEHAGSGLKMPEPMAVRIDELSKDLPADFKYTRCAKAATKFEVGTEDGSRTDVSMVTTDDPDREGDVVLPGGMNLEEFRKSPDVFFAHDYSQIPVGTAKWIRPKDNGIVAMTQYAKRPMGWEAEWLPDAIHSLMQEGMCRGKSVGFVPLSKRVATQDELMRRPDWKGRTLIDKAVMLEYSVAPIPMNPKAMAIAVSKCVKSDEMRKAVIDAARALGTEIDLKDMDSMINESLPACPKCMKSDGVKKTEDGMYMCMKCDMRFGHKDEPGEDAHDNDNKSYKRPGTTNPMREFATLEEAKAHLQQAWKGHGRIEDMSGNVLHQCRCPDGETVRVTGQAKSAEQIEAEQKAAKLNAALQLIVAVRNLEAERLHIEQQIERHVNEKVRQTIHEAFARRKGRA